MTQDIAPMADGGAWLAPGGNVAQAQYVVSPDHIARLQHEGWQIVADPRLPDEEAAHTEAEPSENTEDNQEEA